MAVLKYYNTATSAWEYIAASTTANFTTWKKTMAGTETSVSGTDDNAVTLSYTVGLEQVFINGVLQVRGTDYVATTGTSITGLTALNAGDIVTVVCYAPFNVANTVAPTLIDAKGDLIAGTAADVVGRLAVGTDGQMLTAASGQTTGLQWLSPGLIFIGETTFSAVSSQIISLGTAYKNYRIVLSHTGSSVDSNALLRLSLNGTPATSANYNGGCLGLTSLNAANNLTGAGVTSYQYGTNETATTNEYAGFVFDFIDINVARNTKITSAGVSVNSAGGVTTWTGAVLHDVATAYNQVQFLTSTGTFSGRAVVYGYGV